MWAMIDWFEFIKLKALILVKLLHYLLEVVFLMRRRIEIELERGHYACYLNITFYNIIDKHTPIMTKRVRKIDQDFIAYLAKHQYQINIIANDKNQFSIKSEEKIIYWTCLNSLKKSFMQKNSVVNHCYLMIVDRRFTWTIFRVKTNKEEPEQIYTGTLMSEKYQLARIIGIQQIDKKVVIVFNQFRLLYLTFPEEDKPNLQIFCKELIPYGQQPQYQHSAFATENYLPNQQQYYAILCLYQNISPQNGLLLIAYKSNTNSLYSVYAVQYDCRNSYFMSGRNVLHNIQHPIINIYATCLSNHFIVQTQQYIILWKVGSSESQDSFFNKFDLKCKSHLSPIFKEGEIQGYIGVKDNSKITLLSLNKKTCKLQEEQLKINALDLDTIQLYGNLKKQQYYCLTTKQHLYFISGNNKVKVITNDYTSIINSQLYLHPNYNFIIIDKLRGQQNEKILFGNHIFTYDAHHYLHGLLLSNSSLIYSQLNGKSVSLYLTSPLIGIQKLNVSLQSKGKSKTENTLQISIESANLVKDETLYLSSKYQITTQQVNQIGKKQVKIEKMFQQATEYVTRAAVFSNQLIALSIYDQIHIFDSKFVRKYIYCCNGQIKNLFGLNDINLLGVQLFQQSKNANEIMVLILQLDKARKMKNIVIPERYSHIQLSTVINTAQFKLNLFASKLIICSNDALHRFQLQKIQVQEFQLPLPYSPYSQSLLLPILNLTEKNTTDFLLIFREQHIEDKQNDEVQIYFASFSNKYLFKKMDFSNITLNFQRILTLSVLPRDYPLFAIVHNYEEGLSKSPSLYRNLLICGQKYVSMCCMKVGRIELQWLQNQSYLKQQLNKLECLPRQVVYSCDSLKIEKPIKILPTRKKQYFIVYNMRQIYYTLCSCSKLQQISYYSLINDDFTQFRNNISVGQIEDQTFMQLFNKKMVIKDIKYLNDSTIFVLYQSQIVVLEIGFNNSLIVKQQLKFKSEGDTIQIQQFLQNYDESSIYLRDMHQRIYVLKYLQGAYQIILHSNMDDDVLLFSRVAHWNQRQRVYLLANNQQIGFKQFDQELVLKKDGQLVVNNIISPNKDSNKMIYL